MTARSRVMPIGLDAARAATILATGMRPSASTNQLTLADHAHVLAALCDAFTAITGDTGVLRRAATLAEAHAPFPLDYHGYAARDVHTRIEAATRDASAAGIPAARTVLRAHVRILDADGHPHGRATRLRNLHLGRARAAAEEISALAAKIRPDGNMADLDWALRAACDILHALGIACNSQAALLDAAYAAARLGRRAAPVTETLRAAGAALALSCGTLMCAQEAAEREAHRLQMAS